MIHTWEKTKKKSCLTHEINSISYFKTMNILCILGGEEGEQHICYCSHTKRNLSKRESTVLYGQINKNLLSYYNIMVITWINYVLGDSSQYTIYKTSNIAVATNRINRSSGKTNKNKQTNRIMKWYLHFQIISLQCLYKKENGSFPHDLDRNEQEFLHCDEKKIGKSNNFLKSNSWKTYFLSNYQKNNSNINVFNFL